MQAALKHGLNGEAGLNAASDAVGVTLAPTPSQATALFKAILQRQCTRGDCDAKPLSNEGLHLLERAGTADGVRVLLLTDRGKMEQVLDHVVQTLTRARPAGLQLQRRVLRFLWWPTAAPSKRLSCWVHATATLPG